MSVTLVTGAVGLSSWPCSSGNVFRNSLWKVERKQLSSYFANTILTDQTRQDGQLKQKLISKNTLIVKP